MVNEQKEAKQNFVMTADAPRFASRILATVNNNTIILSFGVENPVNNQEAHMHTRIAMPLAALESIHNLLGRIREDLDTKKAMKGIQYDQIPSDS